MPSNWLLRGRGFFRCAHEILFALSVGFTLANALMTHDFLHGRLETGTIGDCINDLLGIPLASNHGDVGVEIAFLLFMCVVAQSCLLVLMYLRLAPVLLGRFVLVHIASLVVLFGAPLSWLYSDHTLFFWPPYSEMKWIAVQFLLFLTLGFVARANRVPVWAIVVPLVADYYLCGSDIWMATAFGMPVVIAFLYFTRKKYFPFWSVFILLAAHYACWTWYMWGSLCIGFPCRTIPAPKIGFLVWPISGLAWLLYVRSLQGSDVGQQGGATLPI
jgi:hypothetical protein